MAYIVGTPGPDFLFDTAEDDVLDGAAGDDFLFSSAGNDVLIGGAGNDFLFSGAGNDTLDGGAGNDTLYGGAGNDTYLFGRGGGQDWIFHFDPTPGDVDAVLFAPDVLPGDIQITSDGGNLHLTIADTGDMLSLISWFVDPTTRIEQISFADGTVWDIATIEGFIPPSPPATEGADSLYGTFGDDVIDGLGGDDNLAGYDGNDTLIGGAGNDTLYGGAGNDTYIFGLGDGSDVVSDYDSTPGNIDTVQFGVGIQTGDIVVTWDQLSLYLTNATTGDTLNLSGFLSDALKIEQVVFADGTIWDPVALESRITVAPGTDGVDFLYGYFGDDVISGLGGDDELYGYFGNDTLDGGAGNDVLNGGAGNDTYLFGRGGGQDQVADQVFEFDSSPSGFDTILFAPDILSGDIQVTRDADNLYLTIADIGDQLILRNWFTDPAALIEQVVFADGTIWDPVALESRITVAPGTDGADVLYGAAGNNTLAGGAGDDTLIGGAGDDSYVFNLGDGVDTIDDLALTGEGNVLQLGAGIDPTALTLSFDGGVLVLDLGGGDQLRLTNFDPNDVYGAHAVETFAFADGTVLSYSQLIDRGFDLVGTAGDDVIFGTNGVDRIAGGDGNDYIISGGGNDTIDGGAGNDSITAGDGANVIYGGEGDDVIDGGAGNDTLYGGTGDDTYYFDAGNGTDTVYDNAGENNTLVFGAGVDPNSITLNLGSLFLNIGNGEGIHLEGFDPNDALGTSIIQTFIFDDGTTLSLADFLARGFDIEGTDANDILTGTSVTDRITGGKGNDKLYGGAGDDTLYGEKGNDKLYGEDGNDNLYGGKGKDYLDGGAGDDTLDGGEGKNTLIGGLGDDTYVVDDRDDVVVENADEGTDTVQSAINYTLGDNVENLTLTGTGNLKATGNALDNVLTGNDGNNVLDGGLGADTLIGGAGNDTYVVDDAGDAVTEDADAGTDTVLSSVSFALSDNVENLTLSGSADIDATGNMLDNVLTGNAGNNVLAGYGGNDTLIGGLGDDTYLFGLGSGQDVIVENDATPGNLDTVQFAFGIDPGSLTVTRDLDNLYLHLDGARLTLANWFVGESFRIEQAIFSGPGFEEILDAATLESLVVAAPGTESADSLFGGSNGDVIDGLGGNDVLYGFNGDDTLDGGTGADTLIGGAGDDTYVVDDAGDVVVEKCHQGTDTVLSSVSYTLGDHVENLTLTGSANINATGNDLDNVLTGNDGNNVLAGGDGDDTYVVNNAGDVVREKDCQGTDTVLSGMSYTLGDNVENLTLTGSGNINATGNKRDNVLTGNDGDNVLDGGKGHNTLIGGAGDDTLILGKDSKNDILFNSGDGWDTLKTNARDSGHDNEIHFGAGITHEDLWFSRSGNNLNINVLGTDDGMTIEGWYSNKHRPIDEFETSNGYELDDKKVALLVQAMASFTATPGSGGVIPTEMPDALQATLAAAWESD